MANPLYLEAFATLLNLIKQGDSLSQALRSSCLFPDFMVYTVKIGEESSLIVPALLKVANFYEAEIDRFVDGISIFLEPVLMIILGLIGIIFADF
jgi:type IV pilus assembly protein PilC